MYKLFTVLSPCKIIMEDVYTSQKETVEFIAGQVIEGRIDIIASKTYLTLSSGMGGIVNTDFFQEV